MNYIYADTYKNSFHQIHTDVKTEKCLEIRAFLVSEELKGGCCGD